MPGTTRGSLPKHLAPVQTIQVCWSSRLKSWESLHTQKKSLWNWSLTPESELRSYQTVYFGQLISWFRFSVNTVTLGKPIGNQENTTPHTLSPGKIGIKGKKKKSDSQYIKRELGGFERHFRDAYIVHAGMQRWTLKMDVKDAFLHEWGSQLFI